jgi:hypothetical protein
MSLYSCRWLEDLSGLGSALPLTTFLDETTYPLALAFVEYADDASVEKAATAFNDSDFGAGIVSATVTRSSLVGMLHVSPGGACQRCCPVGRVCGLSTQEQYGASRLGNCNRSGCLSCAASEVERRRHESPEALQARTVR